MPRSSASTGTSNPHGVRLFGKAIALLALTLLAAHGCERGKSPDQAQPATPPKPPAAQQPGPAQQPAPAPAKQTPVAAAPRQVSPADSTTPADADTSGVNKPTPPKANAPQAPKLPPIPHDDLPENAKAPNEFSVPFGVVVQEFKKGDGPLTLPKAVVTIHFVIHIKDGWKKLQSTYEDGAPVEYRFDDMVDGMSDGIAGMQPGGVRRLIVPPARAFGKAGVKDKDGNALIPPDATLVYDIELISNKQRVVEGGPAPQPAPKFSAIRKDKDQEEPNK